LQALKAGKVLSPVEDTIWDSVSIVEWKEVRGVSVAALRQLQKGPREEGELEDIDKVCAA
jgi:hypothetical protein